MNEEVIDLGRVELGMAAMPESDSGVNQRGHLPSPSRPRGALEFGTEDVFIGESPGSARIEY